MGDSFSQKVLKKKLILRVIYPAFFLEIHNVKRNFRPKRFTLRRHTSAIPILLIFKLARNDLI